MKFNLQLGHFLVCAPTNDVISADMSKVTCERLDALREEDETHLNILISAEVW